MAHIEEDKNGRLILRDDWCVADAIDAGFHCGYNITINEAEEVLNRAAHHFDANIGINWEVLYCHIEDIMRENGVEQFK